MHALRSRALRAGIGAAALLSLVACVPAADKATTDTLAPLDLPPVTGSSLLASDMSTTTVPAIPDPASAVTVTLATISTTAPAQTSATPTTSDSASTTTAPPNSNPGSYTVAARDTISGIARRCAITAQALVDYNKWTDGTSHAIFPGDVVQLPCTPAGSTTATASTPTTTTVKGSTAPSTTVAAGPGGTYTIVAGDYLAGIAKKTGTTVDAIIAVNGWTDGVNHLIIPGQQIKLPAKAN